MEKALEVHNGYALNDHKEASRRSFGRKGMEPDEPVVGTLAKLSLLVTILVFASIIGMKMLFDITC